MTLYLNSKVCLDLKVHVPIKGQGVRTHFYQLHRNPELFLLFVKLVTAWQEGKMAPDLTNQEIDILLELGIFTTDPEQVVQDVPYHCLIGTESMASAVSGHWDVNPACYWQTTPAIPEAIAARILPGIVFGPHFPLLWVEEVGSQLFMPFWFEPDLLPVVEPLLQGQLSPSELPAAWCQVLAHVGILYLKDERPQRQWQQALQQAQRDYQSQGYAVLRGLINPLQLKTIQTYCQALQQEGYFTQGDYQVQKRKWLYKDPAMGFWQHQLAPVFSQIVGETIKPTYTYLTVYHSGAALAPHRDREACQWNVSWHLDNTPTDVVPWPFYLEIDHQVSVVELQPGDAVLYRGTKDEHWREPLAEGQAATVCSMHYVEQGFVGEH